MVFVVLPDREAFCSVIYKKDHTGGTAIYNEQFQAGNNEP